LLVAAWVAGLPSILLVVWGVPFIHWWAGDSVTPSTWLLLGLAFCTVLQGLGNAMAMFLNGANAIRFQLICATLLAGGALVAKIWLTRLWGLPGLAWGTTLAYCVFVAIPYVLVIPGLLAAETSVSPTKVSNV
jgi:O-antigen/teichoic acid export membrane protein